MSARTFSIRDAYFETLGWCTMCGATGVFWNIILLHFLLSEESMSKSKLNENVREAESHAEHRDVLNRRTVHILEIYNETLFSELKINDHSFKVGKRFKNEAGWQDYIVFTEFDGSRSTKFSILCIALIHDNTACIGNVLQRQSEASKARNLISSARAAVVKLDIFYFQLQQNKS